MRSTDKPYQVGERIVQLVIVPIATGTLQQVEQLPVSARGEAGFGSTGAI